MVVLGGGAVSDARDTWSHRFVPGAMPREICIFFVEQLATAPHLAHPEGCAALRIELVAVPCVSRSCESFPDAFDFHLLPYSETGHRL